MSEQVEVGDVWESEEDIAYVSHFDGEYIFFHCRKKEVSCNYHHCRTYSLRTELFREMYTKLIRKGCWDNSRFDYEAKIKSLIDEFRSLYDGDLSGEAVSLLLSELERIKNRS